jgi:hypothetical protein
VLCLKTSEPISGGTSAYVKMLWGGRFSPLAHRVNCRSAAAGLE